MAGRGKRGKSNISFIKPPEPSFLKRLKEQVGFQEGPTIDTKRERRHEAADEEDEGGINFDDEKPVVVQLRPGDLSQEEADKILDAVDDDSDEALGEEGTTVVTADAKITFKKPEKKRSSPDDDSSKSSKKLKAVGRGSRHRNHSSESMPMVKNKGLLSFDDEEHDDD